MTGMEQEDVMAAIKRIAQTPTENDTIHIDYDSRTSRRFRDYVDVFESIGETTTYGNKQKSPLLKLEYDNYRKIGQARVNIDNGSSSSSPHVNHNVKMSCEWALVSNENETEKCVLKVKFGTGIGSYSEECHVVLDQYMIV